MKPRLVLLTVACGIGLLASAAPIKTFPIAWRFQGTNPPPEQILFYHTSDLSTPAADWEVVTNIAGFRTASSGFPDLVLPPAQTNGYWRGVFYHLSGAYFTTNDLVPVTSISFQIDSSQAHFYRMRGSNSFEGLGPFSNAVGNPGPPDGADIYRP